MRARAIGVLVCGVGGLGFGVWGLGHGVWSLVRRDQSLGGSDSWNAERGKVISSDEQNLVLQVTQRHVVTSILLDNIEYRLPLITTPIS